MSLENDFEAIVDRIYMAVVMQACSDYVVCQRCIKGIGTKNGKPQKSWCKIRDVEETLDEIIDFFKGEWYKEITKYNEDLNCARVMKRLDAIVEDTQHWPVMGNIFKYAVSDAEEKAYATV